MRNRLEQIAEKLEKANLPDINLSSISKQGKMTQIRLKS